MRTTKIKKFTITDDLKIKDEEVFTIKEIRVSKKNHTVIRIFDKNYLVDPKTKELKILN
jgi:hypothetical protein